MSSADTSAPAQVRPVRRYRGALLRQYRSEMRLLLTRRRNMILLGVLAVVPVFIGVAVKVSNPTGGDGPQFIDRITGNGLFLVFTAITVSIPFFLPLVIGVVAGDSIAGEAGIGTLRYLLTVSPDSNTREWMPNSSPPVIRPTTATSSTDAAVNVAIARLLTASSRPRPTGTVSR